MTAQEKELIRVHKQSDLTLKISVITAISFTVLYVYEIVIFMSGNEGMPTLVKFLAK